MQEWQSASSPTTIPSGGSSCRNIEGHCIQNQNRRSGSSCADAQLGIQLILTGSSALNIANLTQEPLTGRKWEYFLYPISCGELIDYSGRPDFSGTYHNTWFMELIRK